MNAKPTPLDSEWEYAMTARADGTPVPRRRTLESFLKFKRAVALAGGRALGGKP
jgi:hypothetical protein